MFSSSSQCKYWMFPSVEELHRLRYEANARYVENTKQRDKIEDSKLASFYLTPEEEIMLCKNHESRISQFCRKFVPQMPKSVVATAFQYYKRFYLNNSVMDYHPKHIIATCVYLACKVEEFNVSMLQFIGNIKGDREKAADIILNNELLLMQQLKYHLNVHNPMRAVEGFLIDIKTRYPQIDEPERCRKHIDDFIDKTFLTDACLLFSPSQIALSAIVYAATQVGMDVDGYINGLLFRDCPSKTGQLYKTINSLWAMLNAPLSTPKETIKAIEKKLERCRNQVNNPESQEYKRAYEDEDDLPPKYVRYS